ncbi:DUF6053 domain-containing protein [Lysobacter enzymogenes]
MGGPSGPMLLSQVAAIRNKSLGPEGPPTRAGAQGPPARSDAATRPRCA